MFISSEALLVIALQIEKQIIMMGTVKVSYTILMPKCLFHLSVPNKYLIEKYTLII